MALSGACGGGLDKLNDLNDNGIPDDQEQQETTTNDWPDEVTLIDECPDLCAAAIAEMGDTPGCTVDCGIDILPSFSGVAVTNVAILLTAAAAGDFEAGQSCELVTVCETECGLMLGDCMDALPQPPTPELLGLCTTEYRDCMVEEDCHTQYMSCETGAFDLLEACIDSGEPLEACEALFSDAICNCANIYNACVGSDIPACEEDESGNAVARMSPPIQTGPSRFELSRASLNYQLERLTALSTEVFVMPAFDGAGKAVGWELRSIRPKDPLHSLGLRNRDVVLAVNGKPIANTGADDLLALRKANQVRLTIRRNGTTRQLTYDITAK